MADQRTLDGCRAARSASVFTTMVLAVCAVAAAESWQEAVFPPPNAGRLVFAVGAGGNPACASYDGQNCLWGKGKSEIDFSKLKPLMCGADHRRLYGVTGFEDPKHWCNLALRAREAAPNRPPSTPPVTTPPPVAGARLSEWSDWLREKDNIDYRYRLRWDPATDGPGRSIEAHFGIRNRGSKVWPGMARTFACSGGLMGQTDVTVGPGETRPAMARGPNCRTAGNPDVRTALQRRHGNID